MRGASQTQSQTVATAARSFHDNAAPVAILGWSLFAIEAARETGRPFFIVAPQEFAGYARANRVPFVACDLTTFDPIRARELAVQLAELGVVYSVPLYEPTVEWCGVINAQLFGQPSYADWTNLFRNKAMMKRRAQISNIPVGVFREADDREEVAAFLAHVNEALLATEPTRPVHIKAFDEAGCKGHYVIRKAEDTQNVPEEAFPCLVESDLEGLEIACEIFIHDGQIVFMNISEYVHLGHSVFVPAGDEIEKRREDIRAANQKLVEAFDIERGFIHPEWFLSADGGIHFGEVAYRVPGGNAFELIQRAYGFNPYQAHVLCMDPTVSHERVRSFFPREDQFRGHAGVLLVYPAGNQVSDVVLPEGLVRDPAFVGHDMVRPGAKEVHHREHFVNGTHWGNIYLFSDDPDRIRRLCRKYEHFDFYR